MNNVVVHYRNGSLIKGTTNDIHKAKPMFHLAILNSKEQPKLVNVDELKAVFFVRSFEGEVQGGFGHLRDGDKQSAYGRKAELLFKDGEKVTGFVQAYHENEPMIMLVPERLQNNYRIYVNRTDVKNIYWL